MDTAGEDRRATARDRIMEAALDLFFERGIHAVGVDAIVERAGVAKMSLYNHFGSKDDLVAAFLREKDRRWRESFAAAVEARADSPARRVLAAFDVLEDGLERDGFRGCAFINTAAELPDPNHPGRQACMDHVRWLRGYFGGLLGEAGVKAVERLSGSLAALFQGAIVVSQAEQDSRAIRDARAAAESILGRPG